jgi:ketosteroid isomerase-like protein
MASAHEETVRAFFRAVERNDFDALGRLVGDGYIWIDHTTDVVARTPEELLAAKEEASVWSDLDFVIDRAMDTADGALVAQMTVTQTLLGEWRSVKGTGQRVRREICEIFRFDAEGRIVVEEMYEDALSLMQQLGALP